MLLARSAAVYGLLVWLSPSALGAASPAGDTTKHPLQVHTADPARHAGSVLGTQAALLHLEHGPLSLPEGLRQHIAARVRAKLEQRLAANKKNLEHIIEHDWSFYQAHRTGPRSHAWSVAHENRNPTTFRKIYRETFARLDPLSLAPGSAGRRALRQAAARRVHGGNIILSVYRHEAELFGRHMVFATGWGFLQFAAECSAAFASLDRLMREPAAARRASGPGSFAAIVQPEGRTDVQAQAILAALVERVKELHLEQRHASEDKTIFELEAAHSPAELRIDWTQFRAAPKLYSEQLLRVTKIPNPWSWGWWRWGGDKGHS